MISNTPLRPKRADSFFGLHFDFHDSADNEPIGRWPFANDLARMLREVQPDYVQCDGKGCPGVASCLTEVSTPAPVFEGDALRVWRDETTKAGVGLFIYLPRQQNLCGAGGSGSFAIA